MTTKKQNILLGLVVIAFFFSTFLLTPQMQGDTISYIEAIEFLKGGKQPEGMIFNRIITTFGALYSIIGVEAIFGSLSVSWLAINTVIFAVIVYTMYYLLLEFTQSKKAAVLGMLFVAGNYSLLRFGLNYLMDIGGWAAYVLSLFFVLKYAKYGGRKNLLIASASVGVGGLFKEYAFLGVIPIAAFLIYENRASLKNIIAKSIAPALLATLPIFCVYLYSYSQFNYTYLQWFGANQAYYEYSSRIVEYIKSFGSLLNVLGIIFAFGLYVLWKEWGKIDNRIKLYLISTFASFFPVLFWPAITQRLLFVSVPFVVVVASFLFKKYENRILWFVPVLIVYILVNLFMDSYILSYVNLPI